MVYLKNLGGASISEFSMQWRHWILDVQSKIDAKLFNSDKNLHLIARVIICI